MTTYTVHKRTFEAAKHPKGSDERARLNLSSVTSEYMTSYKYSVIGDHFSTAFKTKQQAIDYVERNSKLSAI